MITSSELAWMRATENQAMASTAIILKPYYQESALGDTTEVWSIVGTVACDLWPIKQATERSTGNQEVSKGEFYISVPYNTDVSVTDVLSIDEINYQVTFVPKLQSWLTNQRVEAYNYNSQITVLTVGDGTPVVMSAGTAIVYVNIINSGTVELPPDLATETTLNNLFNTFDNPHQTSTVNKSSVNSGTVSGTILASNTNRNGLLLFNDSTAAFYFNFGTVASTSNYSLKMESGSYYEMNQPIYKGVITGLWSAVNGSLKVTETELN